MISSARRAGAPVQSGSQRRRNRVAAKPSDPVISASEATPSR